MALECSTKDFSYQAVSYQDIPRFDAGVDAYPEDAQKALSRHPVNQEHHDGFWTQGETVICALASFPSKMPIDLTA